MIAGLAALALVFVPSASADTYTFGDSGEQTGPEEIVFDWSTEAVCSPAQYADLPVRAFRDSLGRIQLTFSHLSNRRLIGSDLGSVQPENADCRVTLESSRNPDPSMYNDREWIGSAYTPDGQTVYALVHQEYHGLDYGLCTAGVDGTCWQNSITLATASNPGDPGSLYTQASPPGHRVANLPYQYDPNRSGTTISYGYWAPSNIIRNSADGYYYVFMQANPYRDQQNGTCLMRTSDLADPTSWRAWDGSDFTVRFVHPYPTQPTWVSKHLCQPLDFERLFRVNSSLTYNAHFDKWIAVGGSRIFDPATDRDVWGIYYSLSDDLITWSDRKLLVDIPLHTCGGFDPVAYPALLDASSTSRNFETTGKSGFVYFTRWNANANGCNTGTSDRDLVRIPFEFNATPRAAFSRAPNPAVAGQPVTFDASSSGDPDGSIARHEWDLDGDGTFEIDSGTTPTVTHSYDLASVGPRTARLRVTDNEGARDTLEQGLTVNARVNFQPNGSAPPGGYVKDIGSAYTDVRRSGWVREDSLGGPTHTPVDLTLNTRERNTHPDQRLDTFIWMQYPPGAPPSQGNFTHGAWELAVPNAAYQVTVDVGDPNFNPGAVERDWVNVEGQSAIRDFVPSPSATNFTAMITVPVTDGRLTIDAIGGTNTTLDYVDVSLANRSPQASFTISQNPVRIRQDLRFDASASSDPDGAVVNYDWDLDGNGTYETDSGSRPTIDTGHPNTLSAAYSAPGHVVVGLRVSDDDGGMAETRQVLTVNAKINFQPYGSAPPSGYLREAGWAWTDSRGSGWVRQDSLGGQHVPLGLTPNARDRDAVSDQRIDTFVHMQYPASEPADGGVTTPGAWEIAVPDGTYSVTVGVGDPSFSSSVVERDWINVEGQNVIRDFVPTPTLTNFSATVTVTVIDGRLTIDAIGGTNTKLDYADITPVYSPSSYARPNGAARVRVNLVPALRRCSSPNTSHAAPLDRGSCSPSGAIAGYAAVANDDSSVANGFARYQYVCTNGSLGDPTCGASGDQADVSLNARQTDVRQKQDLALDYVGELEARVGLRITDSNNGPTGEKATTRDIDFSVTMPCTQTHSDSSTGSLCTVNTGLGAILPGVVEESKRALWEMRQIRVYDGGVDGDGDTTTNNTLFAVQGIAIP